MVADLLDVETHTLGNSSGRPTCMDCRKPARFIISKGLACGTHAYEYLEQDGPISGPMPAQIRSQSSKHQRNRMRPDLRAVVYRLPAVG